VRATTIFWAGLAAIFVVFILPIVTPILFDPYHSSSMRKVRAEAQMAAFKSALNTFQVDVGHYPTNSGAVELLRMPPGSSKWHGPYLDAKAIPKDPWGHDYIYECPGRHNTNSFDLICVGPDGKRGTEDDITNWQIKK
jgi:general secretion pathway protein G